MNIRSHTLAIGLPLVALVASLGPTAVSQADTLLLEASQDITLINNSSGSVSNGTGALIAGRTGGRGPGPLRALLAFDVASKLPRGSTITEVQLTLTVLQAGSGNDNESYALHRLGQPWGEGSSFSNNGIGAPSTTDDATWIHTFFENRFWSTPGGDFNPSPSAVQTVGDSGPVTWGSTAGLLTDVQTWLDDPTADFGWILIGDETRPASARQFASREAFDNVPQLRVTFTHVPEPGSIVLGLTAAIGGAALSWRRSPAGRSQHNDLPMSSHR